MTRPVLHRHVNDAFHAIIVVEDGLVKPNHLELSYFD